MIRSLFLVSAAFVVMVNPVLAEGNVAAGEIVFQRCFACHGMVDPTHLARMGPTLHGLRE